MNPKKFLQIGGVLCLLLGIVGYLWPDMGPRIQFTSVEALTLALLGAGALVLAPLPISYLKKWIVLLGGCVALLLAIMSYMVRASPLPNFYGVASLNHPMDTLFLLGIAAWAFVAVLVNKNTTTVA